MTAQQPLRIGSLFSGYSGLDMGVSQVIDAETAWFCEYDDAPAKILAHHYPDVPNHRDVTQIDWETVEPVDIITGGYPCQPFSSAGQRKGTEDERHLWPYVREAIRRIRPRFALLENVAGHRSLGFDQVLADCAQDGLHVRWTSLRASHIGAPHHRERLFILATSAHPESVRWGTGIRVGGTPKTKPRPRFREDVLPGWESVAGPEPRFTDKRGRLSPRYAEWMMGLPAGWITDVPGLSRADQLKAAGNGVVPQQAAAALRQLLPSTQMESAA